MSDPLERLLQHPSLWRASGQAVAAPAVSTGFAQLDAHLPGGGWPCPALIELLLEQCGLGEIDLLIPALRELQAGWGPQATPRALAWLNPPFIPYAPALAERGLELRQQLITGPLTPAQTLWAMEQALRSGACAVVLAWADKAGMQALRRLKLAAGEGGCLGVLFRSPRRRAQASPANVRVLLSRAAAQLQIELLKVQRGRPAKLALRTFS